LSLAFCTLFQMRFMFVRIRAHYVTCELGFGFHSHSCCFLTTMSSARPGTTASTPLLHAQAGPSNLRPIPGSPAISYTGTLPDPSSGRPRFLSPLAHRRRKASPITRVVPGIFLLAVFTTFIFAAWDVSSVGGCYVPWLCKIMGKGKWRDDEVYWRNTGPYAPFRSMGTGGGQINLPRGCVIDQVNIVSALI
jgi:hypothetical protein